VIDFLGITQRNPHVHFAHLWRYKSSNIENLQVAVQYWSCMRTYNFRS